jgi:hypothetical protein
MNIVVLNTNDSTIGILLGNGDGSFENQTLYSTGFQSQPYSVDVGYFNNDTILDIIVANYAASNFVIFLGYGDGTFTDAKIVHAEYGSSLFSVVMSDLNNDKKIDVVVGCYGSDSLKIMLQTC